MEKKKEFKELKMTYWIKEVHGCLKTTENSNPCLGVSKSEKLKAGWASLEALMVNICLDCWRLGLDPWVGKIPWRRAWQHLQYSCLENPHGQRCVMSYSPSDHKELGTTKWLSIARVIVKVKYCHLHTFVFSPSKIFSRFIHLIRTDSNEFFLMAE